MTPCERIVFLVEEPSMEAFLTQILPGILGHTVGFEIIIHHGKPDLLRKLPSRLLGYSHWLPENWQLVVLVDQDRDDCVELKRQLEDMARAAGFAAPEGEDPPSRIIHRIVVEELESWFFGDWLAVREAYPRVSMKIARQTKYRDPDSIRDPWETFEKILQKQGYFPGGLEKITAARKIAKAFDPERNRSHSFQVFYRTLSAIREQNLSESTG